MAGVVSTTVIGSLRMLFGMLIRTQVRNISNSVSEAILQKTFLSSATNFIKRTSLDIGLSIIDKVISGKSSNKVHDVMKEFDNYDDININTRKEDGNSSFNTGKNTVNDVEFRCFVGGLAWATNDKTLADAFAKCGKVVDSKITNDHYTGRSRGFGFVTFSNEKSMKHAISQMNGSELDGRIISVKVAQSRGSCGGSGGGGIPRRCEGWNAHGEGCWEGGYGCGGCRPKCCSGGGRNMYCYGGGFPKCCCRGGCSKVSYGGGNCKSGYGFYKHGCGGGSDRDFGGCAQDANGRKSSGCCGGNNRGFGGCAGDANSRKSSGCGCGSNRGFGGCAQDANGRKSSGRFGGNNRAFGGCAEDANGRKSFGCGGGSGRGFGGCAEDANWRKSSGCGGGTYRRLAGCADDANWRKSS